MVLHIFASSNPNCAGPFQFYSRSNTLSSYLLKNQFTIIIPAYNEEKRIIPVLNDITNFISLNKLPWHVIIAVDGNDDTSKIVKSFAMLHPFVICNESPGRNGKGGSIKRATTNLSGEYVILMDADNAISFQHVVEKIPLIKENTGLILSRYHSGNEVPFVRRFLSRSFNVSVRALTGLKIKDTQSGYKIFKQKEFIDALKKVGVTNTFFDIPLLYHISSAGGKIVEIPADYNHTKEGKFNPFGGAISLGISLITFKIRHSKLYDYVPDWMKSLYMRKFRWL